MTSVLLVLVALLSILVRADTGQAQAPSVLHITARLAIPGRTPIPVARHALLISDNPATASPRRVLTGADGSVDVRLRPGNYTVESDEPLVFEGQAYQWTEIVDIVAGRDAALELTAANAEIGPAGAAPAPDVPPSVPEPSSPLAEWRDSVVEIWTPTSHAAGFLVDATGLVATSRVTLGAPASIEVQIAPAIKVAAKILSAEPSHDVAVVWIDANAVRSVRPVPLACAPPADSPLKSGERISTVEVGVRRPKEITPGTVRRVTELEIESDLSLLPGASGGPVFSQGGLVGMAVADDRRRRGDVRVVRTGAVCDAVAAAAKRMSSTAPPSGALLPVEPAQPIPADALKAVAARRGGSLNPYQISSAGFDVAFITPVMTFAVQQRAQEMDQQGARTTGADAPRINPLTEFGSWFDYVADVPPVLLVRVTPRLVEGFWTRVGRVAAMTQGAALPPFKRFSPGFLRMRAFCGDAEVTPIHPFRLEQRISESDAIYEGLYVFDPGALAPSCGSVKLVLYSEKEPQKADTQTVDPKVIQLISQDFAALRP